jgi:hypothetical protein
MRGGDSGTRELRRADVVVDVTFRARDDAKELWAMPKNRSTGQRRQA